MSAWHAASAHVSLSYIYCKLLWQEIQIDAKVRKIVGVRVRFYHFLYVTPQI